MILHVDMDAFYAAIEEREKPELTGLPIIVGADPGGRGVVSTCSYAARVFGVRSAMPIREAHRRCPQGVFLPVRMELYLAESERIMDILGRFTPLVEPLSVDEAFLDVSGCEGLFGPPAVIAAKVKDEIRRETRLACSVGVAPNKFLAKLATELGKPDGLTVIEPDRIREILHPLPVERVFGVGKKTAERLAQLGIRTVGQIASSPAWLLAGQVGEAAAAHMQGLASGEDERVVQPRRLPKQLGSERTYMVDVDDPREMRRTLLELSDQVGSGLRRHGYRTRSVRLKLRTEDFHTVSRTRTLPRPTDSDRVIYRTACELLAVAVPELSVRLLGVTASELLHGDEPEQTTLFGPPEEEVKLAKVERATDRVREKFGRDALRPATLVGQGRTRR